jgi:hypothetical protein
MRIAAIISLVSLSLALTAASRGGELIVQLPPDANPVSAAANAPGPDLTSDGQIDGNTIRFQKLLPDIRYNVKITLKTGVVLQGVDLNWYNEDPAKPGAAEFSGDDRKEIQAILRVPSFYNKSEILQLKADHDRATALVQLIRDQEFHADKGGEIIWRIELWYFKNEFGGWAAINQANKVLRRERFTSAAEYQRATTNAKWISELGGISVLKDRTVNVIVHSPKDSGMDSATTRPGG